MIQGTFTRNENGKITSFIMTGHAEAGEYGSDIVCSAASALAVNAVNSIDSLAGITPDVETNDTEGGYLSVKIDGKMTGEQRIIVQVLLESLLLGLQATEESYSEFIKVKTIKEN